MRELAARLALSSSHLYALIQQGRFPKPVALIPGGRAKGWPERELTAWLQNRVEIRDLEARSRLEASNASQDKGGAIKKANTISIEHKS
jgi:predicted DNA-binding transcriptional regulator AlpA